MKHDYKYKNHAKNVYCQSNIKLEEFNWCRNGLQKKLNRINAYLLTINAGHLMDLITGNILIFYDFCNPCYLGKHLANHK